MIGRSTFGVADKYCSRKQAMILIDDSGEITITPVLTFSFFTFFFFFSLFFRSPA